MQFTRPSGVLTTGNSTENGRTRERHRRLLLSGIVSSLAKGVSIVAGLVTVPLTLNYLGAERYGLWMTVNSALSMLWFADLGIGNGVVTNVASALAANRHRRASEVISSAAVLLCSIGLIALALFLTIYPLVRWADVFNVRSTVATAEAGPALLVLTICLLANIPLGLAQRVQMACQEAYVSGFWTVLAQVASLIALFSAVRLRSGLPGLILAIAGTQALVSATSLVVLFGWQHPDLRPRLRDATSTATQVLIKAGGWYFAIQLISIFHSALDTLIIARLLGPAEVSRYAVGTKMALLVPMMAGMWLMPLWPATTEAAARDDWGWIRRAFRRSLLASMALSAAGAGTLVLFGRTIVHLWLGDSITLTASNYVALGIFQIVLGVAFPIAMLLNGLNILREQVALAAVMVVVSIVARLHFARTGGLTAVILASALSQLFLSTLPCIWLLARALAAHKPTAMSSVSQSQP